MRFFTNSPRRCVMGVSSGRRGRPRSRCICRVHVHHRPPFTDMRRGLVYGTYVYDRCRCIQWHSPSYTLGNRPDTSDRHCKRRVKAAWTTAGGGGGSTASTISHYLYSRVRTVTQESLRIEDEGFCLRCQIPPKITKNHQREGCNIIPWMQRRRGR